MATLRNRSTRPGWATPAQSVPGAPAMIDSDLISQPDHDDEPEAVAERAWLERVSARLRMSWSISHSAA